MSFKYNFVEQENSFILTLIGKIMSEEDIRDVNDAVQKHLDIHHGNLIMDFSQLTYINSTGINFVMRTLTKTRIKNGDLILFGINGIVESLFKMTKLNEIYTIYSSQEEAVNHFKK